MTPLKRNSWKTKTLQLTADSFSFAENTSFEGYFLFCCCESYTLTWKNVTYM
jgi:hypothetical protein